MAFNASKPVSRSSSRLAMGAGISLANKCQLLFGVAVLAILAAALAVPWVRTGALVREGQFEAAREVADEWLAERRAEGPLQPAPGVPAPLADVFGDARPQSPPRVALVGFDALAGEDRDPFLAEALRRFVEDRDLAEYTDTAAVAGRVVYRYARALRDEKAVLLVDRTSRIAAAQVRRSRIYILIAWLGAGLGAVIVFYLILTKLILSPVRRLRETTEKVQGGDLTARSQIRTGDEFEELAAGFNTMLDQVEQSQAQLRSVNESLDLKLSELSEANIGLFESNRLKSEFLANVSHELRTPLNSIIGFAEVLDELSRNEPEADPKRLRYINHILTSGRSLLEMINELLQMAKIEAGRMEVSIEPTSASDLIEGLTAIMRPQAEGKQLDLKTQVARNLPTVETDPGKLQQILYNFLSNAIKFTPSGGTVTVTADRVSRDDRSPGLRIGVSDTGPGVPYDQQEAIFEKFRQVDAGHTRQHSGTGLGLAICRELAELLGARVSLVSNPGHGATFFVDLPLTFQSDASQPLMSFAPVNPPSA
jgi:signal transduction histidine kinase